jgi:hypothetical protein
MELIDIVENLEFNLRKLPIFQISTVFQIFHPCLGLEVPN